MKILVTGATGYIGGRLVPRLIEKGYDVRCMARSPETIKDRWDKAEVVYGDVFEIDSLRKALKNIDSAYYLIHSMSSGNEFSEKDIIAADNFGKAAKENGVKRIIYLGGLGSGQKVLSPHLKSRHETGDTLRKSGVKVTEFRAGMIVGSGSVSFEMVRYLTERLPFMICPKWVLSKTEPIAVRDVLRYLIESLENGNSESKILDIGSGEKLTYAELMKTYAKVRGLKRYMIFIPVLSPRLSSYWVDFVTPIPKNISRPLIEGLRYELVVKDDSAREIFDFELIPYEEAVRLALEREMSGGKETIWSNASSSLKKNKPLPLNLEQTEGMLMEIREREISASPEKVFKVISSMGGEHGWYANYLWKLRGFMDRLAGGPGMRRKRRDHQFLRTGDPLDFWRVEAIEQNRLLRLRAEMKLPGKAWLQYTIEGKNGYTLLNQTAFYEPKGLFGLLYWYSIYFLHKFMFGGMINDIKKKSEKESD